MKQVLVKGGRVIVEEVPPPAAAPGMCLVRVSHSLISSGTESGLVSGSGTAGYVLDKAKDPLNIEKVKRKLATAGVRSTIEVIRDKLNSFQAPGYSSAGVIIETGADVPGFRAGDRVACAGVGYASHAEYNAVPHALLTPVPDGVPFDEAAFVALGAIAMQGVRRIEPAFGETVVVSGLGLVGQLAAQIARCAGCHVIGCDPVPEKRALADQLGCEAVCDPGDLPAVAREWSAGHGLDAAIICAASKESGVTNQALGICREKGRVVAVGDVGLDLQRAPLYRNELDFRLSCSYGPGRYNTQYEERGLDYPIAYVRWTEGRNMSEFLRMIAEDRILIAPLITAVHPVDEAQAAYDAVLEGGPAAIAALIRYGDAEAEEAPALEKRVEVKKGVLKRSLRGVFNKSSAGIAVIGAGNLARAFHLPNLGRSSGCHLEAVADRVGSTAKEAAEKYGARYCVSDYTEVLQDEKVDAVIIATRHNLHHEIALAAIQAGKHVFVEKPLALTVPDCEELVNTAAETGVLLTVGFNRRFAPLAREAKAAIPSMAGPKMLVYRCNAGTLPPGHWATDPVEGGGRIVGECVHFFDLCCWLLDSEPVSLAADRIDAPPANPRETSLIAEDNLSVILRFQEGSTAVIIYSAVGHSDIAKERIEIFGGNAGIVIDDYRGIEFAGLPGKNRRSAKQDKGMCGMLDNFIQAIRGKAALSVTADHGLRATRLARAAIEACTRNGSGAAL
jgi:predicted dehydrogenase/threonine dehydrogenase-like Zn-dependent dehydrogenase